MSKDFMEKLNKLSPDKQQEVEDFMNFLLSKGNNAEEQEAFEGKRMKNMGRMHGQIWMAEDFDETPEDFKDYI